MPNQQYSTFLPSGALELSRPPNLRHYSDSMVSPRGLAPRANAINHTGSPSYIPGNLGSGTSSSYISPLTSPPARHASSPYASHSHLHHSSSLASPPISRAGSSDGGAAAALVEDWRSFTRKLREQFATERATMQESRIRSEEVMAEERALWDKERACYEARIAELEGQLATFTGPLSTQSHQPHASYFPSLLSRPPQTIPLPQSSNSNSGPSTAGGRSTASYASKSTSIASNVPQESGKTSDGSFFYAPVSEATRTFDPSPSSDVRVDSLHVPGETPLHVTSKELTSADFLSPPATHSNGSGLVSPNRDSRSGSVVGDSIDISLLAPGLEGVPIRREAVEPAFAAHIMSPLGSSTAHSPDKLSPDGQPPARPVQNYDFRSPEAKRRGSHGSIVFERRDSGGSLGSRSSKGSPKRCGPKKTLEIIKQPHERRLTMHAGHTPNHSVIHFELGDSGLTTPKASKINKEMESELGDAPRVDVHVVPEGMSCVTERLRQESFDSGDYELTGPLGLKNEAAEDDIFLKALTSKLEEVKEMESDEVSITTTEASEEDEMPDQDVLRQALQAIGRGVGSSNIRGGDGIDDDVMDSVPDDVPILRLKPSVNFGRPLGSL